MQKQYKGQMTRDEEKELDRKLGNFYSITLCGKTHKINNCVIARAFIGFVVVFTTFFTYLFNLVNDKKYSNTTIYVLCLLYVL